jgi:MipA family protein
MRRFVCLAIAACCLSSPALAQPAATGALPNPEDLANRDSFSLGVGAAIIPDYEGSDDYKFTPLAAVRGQYHGISFYTLGSYLYVDVLPSNSKVEFDAGPIVGFRSNKRRHIEDEVVEDLRKTKSAFEVGGFAGVSMHGVTNPYDTLSFRVDVLRDVGSAHKSTLVSPNVLFSTPLSQRTYVAASLGAEFAGGKYADYYYSIDADNSARTGGILPLYNADGGMKNWKLGLLVNQSITGDLLHGFSIFGAGQYSRLVGDFADSPIVDDRGSASQWIGAAGVAFTW